MKKMMTAALVAALALIAAACGGGSSVETLNVAYFSGWPLPPQLGMWILT